MRVLVCGIASIALIVAGALALDWYRLAFEPPTGGALRIAIDLRSLHLCHLGQACVRSPLGPLPGMFPTLAMVTMWSSLGVAAIVAFQAGVRISTGRAYESLTKVGYMVSLMAISIAVATAYLFGPQSEGSVIGAAAQAGVLLQRTWAPLTLLAGLVAGFATLYMAVAPEARDLATAAPPVKRAPARPEARTRTPAVRIPFPEHTGTFPILDGGATGTAAGARPAGERRAAGTTPIPLHDRPAPGPAAADLERSRERRTTDMRARPTTDLRAPRTRTVAGIQPIRAPTATGERTATGSQPIGVQPATRPSLEPAAPTAPQPGAANAPARSLASDPPPLRERAATGVYPIPAIAMPGPTRGTSASHEPLATRPPDRERPATSPPLRERAATGVYAIPAIAMPGPAREAPAGPVPAIRAGRAAPTARVVPGPAAAAGRPATGQTASDPRPALSTGPVAAVRAPTGPVTAVPAASRAKTGPIVAAPPHLRLRLSYVAITAELTAGGIDARREDGLSRLVLWRDVVGVVARRMPPVYDGLVFIDVVSSAGSTLRIVPWTRLAGAPIASEADARPRSIVEHVALRCPGARLDPATRQFLETGTAAQLPDLETLRAHDERLA
jgi:hypothetical protein